MLRRNSLGQAQLFDHRRPDIILQHFLDRGVHVASESIDSTFLSMTSLTRKVIAI